MCHVLTLTNVISNVAVDVMLQLVYC
uniref:Uncharacterized protein n=1 Tax=Anguilla anguilla TaxID=7936 RepID=A0A0E9UC52_ANGAN